jgi:hypothetical protein
MWNHTMDDGSTSTQAPRVHNWKVETERLQVLVWFIYDPLHVVCVLYDMTARW